MFYQEALPKFRFLSRVNSLLEIGDRHWQKVAAMFEKAESANSLPFAVYFHMGAYFCMGAYKRDVVVVIKMGAYIHGCLFCVGAYYPDFTVLSIYSLVYLYLVYCLCTFGGGHPEMGYITQIAIQGTVFA